MLVDCEYDEDFKKPRIRAAAVAKVLREAEELKKLFEETQIYVEIYAGSRDDIS